VGLRALPKSRTTEEEVPGLRDFIPAVSRGFLTPHHLGAAIDRLEAFETTPFRFVLSVPPRHAKTETVLHFIAWALKKCPWLNIAYITYSQDQANTMSRKAQALCLAAGVRLVKAAAREWTTAKNEYNVFTSIDGPLTGKGFHIVIIDDPYKNRSAAESPAVRAMVEEAFRSDIRTRLKDAIGDFPGGSILEMQTRWHEEDLAGYLTKGGERGNRFVPFEYIRLRAIENEGTDHEVALWPEGGKTLEALHAIHSDVLDYAWASLYQGEPRPRGAKVFKDAWYYQELPKGQIRAAIGLDLAYSTNTKSDHSVALVLVRTRDGLSYVADRKKLQCEAPQFKIVVRALSSKYPGARMRWYGSGTEKGTADFFNAKPDAVPLEMEPASKDKMIRATPAAAAWNRGDILVKQDAPWADDFLRVVNGFTGSGDKEDDDVDALAAAFDLLEDPRTARVSLPGGPPSPAPRI
jgi:predicted phage terminase large subunit-like protein